MMNEYLEKLKRQIRYAKQGLIHDGETICISLEATTQQLIASLDDPTQYVINSLGELQANAAIYNARCGALAAQVRIYKELMEGGDE